MIESEQRRGTGRQADRSAALPRAATIEGWIEGLQGGGEALTDAERIDAIRALERLTCAAAAAQAELTAELAASQRARAAEAGVPAARQSRGIAAQVALARRESHHRGQSHLGLALVLRDELPCTMRAFRAGRCTEWMVTIIARETACLSLEDRRRVDAEIAGDPAALEAMGLRELGDALRRRACELDPAAVAARRRRAEADRHTSLRPAPDTMTRFSALLSVKDGVSVHAALLREADRLRAAGDPRSRGQVMADTLVQRVLSPHLSTHLSTLAPTHPATPAQPGSASAAAALPLMIDLVVPADVLLGDGEAGGCVDGYGEVPGDLLRAWIADHLEQGLDVWLRRLYARPASGELVAMDSRARRFTGHLADFLRLRDRRCRTPWCDAPVRHLDHVEDHDDGGPTSAANGQGLCEACNHAKQSRGWRARARPGPRHTVETTTPTGHRYRSVAPSLLPRPGPGAAPLVEIHLAHEGPLIELDLGAA